MRELVFRDDVERYGIAAAPIIGTDEAIAVKCPECKNVYIEYNDIYNSFCPTCGIMYEVK